MSKEVSKLMSYALRHKPEELGITLDAQGWTDTYELLVAIQHRFPQTTMDDLIKVVSDSDKQRFQILGSNIRANQGHSVAVDLALQPSSPPATLYHGTKREFLSSIMANGLNKGSRHHVHLSATTDTAEIVARRRKGESVILSINAAAMEGQHEFYVSENGVWLTDHVPAVFIDVLN